jgi:hypothetical protein
MHNRHRDPTVPFVLAAGVMLAALLWLSVGVPTLVRYPTDLDATTRYSGTFTVLVEPSTGATLPRPTGLPLTIERHIRGDTAASDSSLAVVDETVRQRAGDLIDATQTNRYVVDRRTVQNVADERSYAFRPSNVVDRSGTYRLNLPFDTTAERNYPVYNNDTGRAIALRPDRRQPTVDTEGLRLLRFTSRAVDIPLDDAYLAELRALVPLPEARTIAELEPQLQAVGIDVGAVLDALAPVVSTADATLLARLAGEPIPLEYVVSFDGRAAVEPLTGVEVDVGVTQTVGVRPVLAGTGELRSVLASYPDVPEAVAAIDGLAALADAPPTPLFEFRYGRTADSVAEVADEVSAMRTQILVAKRVVPFTLLAVAVVLVAVGALRWRRRPPPGAPDSAGEAQDARPYPADLTTTKR